MNVEEQPTGDQATHAGLVVERAEETNWERVKAVRLAALAESPSAFGSTLAEEREYAEGHTIHHMRWLVVCSVVALLSACSQDKGFPSTEVSADEYGPAWPLTVDEAVLACEAGDVLTLTVEGRSYGIDGMTDPSDADRGLRSIWAKDSETGTEAHRDLGPLVEDARALCD